MSRENDAVSGGVDESTPADHDLESLRLAQSEARAVLDHQIQTISDVDDKAAKTFRLDVILLGLLVTAASFVAQVNSVELSPYVNVFTVSAVVALIVSFLCAVLTYTGTETETGMDPSGIDRLISNRYSEKEWLVLLLRSEAEWMRQNERRHSTDVRYLYWSHGAVFVAILLLVLGIATVHPLAW